MTDVHFSPSAIETAWLCLRKWAFRAIDHAPYEQTEAAILGDHAHKYRENWLIQGLPPLDDKPGRLARVGLEKLPPPGYAMVERTVSLRLAGRPYSLMGRIDFFLPNRPVLLTGERVYPFRGVWGRTGNPIVGDHKTTGVDKTTGEDWGKTEQDLRETDAQATFYGAWGLYVTGARFVDLHWSYMIKATTPRERQLYVTMSREEIYRNYQRNILPTTDTLYRIKSTPGITANDVPHNMGEACEAFGGCPYRKICKIPHAERLRQAFMNNNAFPTPPTNGFPAQPPMQQPQQQYQQPQMFPQTQQPAPQQQQPFPMPATGALNAQLDAAYPTQQQPQPAPAPVPAQQTPQPTHEHWGYAALKLSRGQPDLMSDPPEVQYAMAMLRAQPDQIPAMLAYAPQTVPSTNPNTNLFVQQSPQGQTVTTAFPPQPQQPQQPPQPQAPPGWLPGPQPGTLQAAPGNMLPPDANLANTTLTTPEEKKKGKKASTALSADAMSTLIVLLGRCADALEDLAESAKKS